MLLTVSQPSRTDFGFRPNLDTHDFAPRLSHFKPRVSPTSRADSPVSSLQASGDPLESRMSTPHRGLPPPSAMVLPEPGRGGPLSLGQSLGPMPAPPAQWQGQEDSMRNWLGAKVEEDKRKQEEEKTRQETLRLEQRKIEQAMLRESLQGGVPPGLIPLIYAGIGGASLANLSMELVQQYSGQLQAAQQQIQYQSSSPDAARDSRLIGLASTSGMYSGPPQPQQQPQAQPQSQQQPQHAHPQHHLQHQPPPPPVLAQSILPSQAIEQPPAAVPMISTFPAYPSAQRVRAAPTSAPHPGTQTQLPRLTTNEMSIHQPSMAQGSGPIIPSSQEQSTSPSIHFHHWVPPGDSKPSVRDNPATPANKAETYHSHSTSHLSEGEYRDSPRKRKAQGSHQANPPPPSSTSPSFSTGSSGSGLNLGHLRSRSNTSAGRYDPDSRPGSSRREPYARQPMPRRRSDEQNQPPQPRPLSRTRESHSRPSSADGARRAQHGASDAA